MSVVYLKDKRMTNDNKNKPGASGEKDETKANQDEPHEVDTDETVTVSTLNLKALEAELWSDEDDDQAEKPDAREADQDKPDTN